MHIISSNVNAKTVVNDNTTHIDPNENRVSSLLIPNAFRLPDGKNIIECFETYNNVTNNMKNTMLYTTLSIMYILHIFLFHE
jgi:hypothetical protein